MRIYGVDFTSAPCARKPITVACGHATDGGLLVSEVEQLADFESFESFLQRPGPWIGGFDFPFGLSREAIADLEWPQEWTKLLAHCRTLGRSEFKRVLDAYRESRPKGRRYAKRLGDAASGAHPSVKLVRPPVGFMFFEGAWRLAHAMLHIPGLRPSDVTRIALEAYPGLLVRKQLGIRDSYKSDDPAKHTAARRAARERIVAALMAGRPLGVRLRLAKGIGPKLIEDGSADWLDAVICAVQAHWGWSRQSANFGLPPDIDPVEGWIVTA